MRRAQEQRRVSKKRSTAPPQRASTPSGRSAGAAPETGGVWYFDRPRGELAYRFQSGREARFRLVRGAEAAGGAGTLGGVGLLRVDTPVGVNP